MAVKTDMSKAYDRLEWEFISLVLSRMGFHPKWITLIMQCITTITYSFLINGSPRGRVKPSRGIRQGDPLSPYIFILCSEVLLRLCNKAQAERTLKGVKVARGCPRINHLLFADDTMFFTNASEQSSKALKDILLRYEAGSGQYINTAKSSVSFSRRAPPQLKSKVKDIVQIPNEGGIGKYLGLPEPFGRKKKDLFASIVDKIKQKAKSWRNRFLSSAGKMVMVKSVLSTMPSHSMTCFKLPISLCNQIQSAVTRFWWDSNSGAKKMAWVSWDEMAQTKTNGGLGFREFECFNDAFPTKLRWRLLNNPTGLLARTLFGKYCQHEEFTKVPAVSAISHGWRGVLIGRDLLMRNMGWAVGDGKTIKVWQDPWLSPSRQLQPMGPPTEASHDIVVADLFQANTQDWDLNTIERELPELVDAILSIKPSKQGAPDKLFWIHTKDGIYTTKSGYISAVEIQNEKNARDRRDQVTHWNKGVWNLQTAPKIQLLIWKALKGDLPVGEQMKIRQLRFDPHCKRCGNLESINHLIFQCDFAMKMWKAAPFAQQIDRRGSLDLENDWMQIIVIPCLPPVGIITVSLAPWIVWALWTARNSLIFNDKGFTTEQVLTKAIVAAKEWQNAQTREVKQHQPRRQTEPPPCYGVVVQTDAAWIENSRMAGIGWIIKQAECTQSFQNTSSFVTSPLMAEGLAMRDAIRKCKELGIWRFRCESDSTQLIKALNSKMEPPELYGIIADIRLDCTTFDSVSFIWIPRLRNVDADRLAKQALNLVAVPTA